MRIGRDRRLPQRLGHGPLEHLVGGLHPRSPLGKDRQAKAAGVLVELADQRVHPGGIERRPRQAVERREDPDIGRIASEGPAADRRELLDVVGAHVARPRLERHDVAQLSRRDLLGHDADQRPVAVHERRDRAVGDRHRRRDDGRRNTRFERLRGADVPAQAGDRLGRRVQRHADQRPGAGPSPSTAAPSTAPPAAPSPAPRTSASSSRPERLRLRRSAPAVVREYRGAPDAPGPHILSGALTPSRSSPRAIVRFVVALSASRKDSVPSPSAPTTWQSR